MGRIKKHRRKLKLPAWVEKWLLPALIDLMVGLITAIIIKLLGLN